METTPGRTPETRKTPHYVSPQEAARQLGVSVVTLRRAIRDGRLTAYRLGKRTIRINEVELQRLLRKIPSADFDG
jgi:excisionase family DNA binding protein